MLLSIFFNLNFLFENSKYLIEQGCHVNDGQQTVYEKLPYHKYFIFKIFKVFCMLEYLRYILDSFI